MADTFDQIIHTRALDNIYNGIRRKMQSISLELHGSYSRICPDRRGNQDQLTAYKKLRARCSIIPLVFLRIKVTVRCLRGDFSSGPSVRKVENKETGLCQNTYRNMHFLTNTHLPVIAFTRYSPLPGRFILNDWLVLPSSE
jgi:hypothetical protein